MATREQIAKALGYPRDWRGNIMGPEKFDSDNLPSSEQVRGSHSPGWSEDRIAKARARGAWLKQELKSLKRHSGT